MYNYSVREDLSNLNKNEYIKSVMVLHLDNIRGTYIHL